MKRRKASASANEKLGKPKIEELGNCSSYADLPSDIITKIMLTLPIESILICKCVCNNWKAVISDSHFAKLHLQRAHVRYMFRITDEYHNLPVPLVSRTLYLLPQISEIECKNHLKLKPTFKLPLRNGKYILENLKYESKRPIRAAAAAAKLVLEKSPSYIACNPNYMKFYVVNSCNGLLCLASPSLEGGFKLPIVICNPVTGEFITLPKPRKKTWYNKGKKHVRFGFGFEPKTNEYKVMKMWSTNANKLLEESSLFIEIYTLGTPTWRNVEVDPEAGKMVLRLGLNWKLEFLTCVNGALHWIGFTMGRKVPPILCFNFESEKLQSFPSPPHDEFRYIEIRGIGELRGFLYLCCNYHVTNATIVWVMKKYGDGESWTKAYSVDSNKPCLKVIPIPWYCLCCHVKHLEEGAAAVAGMLLFHPGIRFTYDVPERFGFKNFQLFGTQSREVEVIPHIPSLVSLMDIVKGGNIEVLNIHSRCAKVKLEEENEVISLDNIYA